MSNRIHGLSTTPTYKIWANMKYRCNNPKAKAYPHYGGRGISYDPNWETFENFLTDMGERPGDLSLDRRDNSLGYCKNNCRWADMKEQSRNTRNNHLLTFRGVTKCLQEWCDELGFTYTSIYSRLNRGWSVDRALTTPTRGYNRV